MFDDSFYDFLKLVGSNSVDALRVLRPGGPLDTRGYRSACKACGFLTTQPLRWFHEREFACFCGGEFDKAALNDCIAAFLAGDLERARGNKALVPIHYEGIDDD